MAVFYGPVHPNEAPWLELILHKVDCYFGSMLSLVFDVGQKRQNIPMTVCLSVVVLHAPGFKNKIQILSAVRH